MDWRKRSPSRIVLYIGLGIPLLGLLWLLLVRLVRAVYRFPMPEFLANVIDNPLRRRLQPPDATAVRHGLQPGMTVLEIGPGSGTYTLGAARRGGPAGFELSKKIGDIFYYTWLLERPA